MASGGSGGGGSGGGGGGAAAKLPPKIYVVGSRVLARRPTDKMPLDGVVTAPREADGLWGIEGAAPLGKCRLPDAQLAPSFKRDEEVSAAEAGEAGAAEAAIAAEVESSTAATLALRA